MRRFWLLLVLAYPLAAETDTRVVELQTAGYYELLDRAKELGLPLTGGADELRSRVAAALKITLPPPEKAGGKTLTIDSAQEAGLVDVNAPGDGKLLRLSGGLQVTLVDHEKNVTHIVVADELWYDQANEEMTARGRVVYTMVREQSKEVFRGDSLTFRLNDSQGVFYGGASDRTRSVGDQALVFRYQGDAIRRSASDLVVMDSGTITSSLGKDPYYRIRAKKIWVLAPGEWGLQDAVLYLGRVPVMYFPFFFQPGDEFFFNPVLSFPEAGDRHGTSLQTTTYFWGHKKKDTAPLSFLQLEDSSTDDDQRVQKGLFLVKGKPPESTVPATWTLRYLADFYSNLGFLTAVDVAVPGWLGTKNFTAFAGLGVTRTVDSTGFPFSVNPFQAALDPWEQSDWNGSWLGGTRLPFRWGGSFAFDVGIASASLEYYTDPLLYNDLTGSRSENFSVFSLLGLGPAQKTAVASAKSSLLWSAALKDPVNLSGSLLWDTKTAADAGPSGDPENTFYRPSQLTLPQISANWSGTLWPLPAVKEKPGTESGLLSPDTVADASAEAQPVQSAGTSEAPSGDESGPSAPRRLDNRPLAAADPTWNTGVTWTLRPSFKTDSRFDPKDVDAPSDPAWTVLTSRWTGSYDGSLGWNTGWSDGSLTASQTFALRQQFQDTWYQGESVTDAASETYRRQDLDAETGLFTQTFNSGWKPWAGQGPLRDSALQYSLATKLWESKQQKISYYDGTKDTVTTHQTTATAAWYLWEGIGSLKSTSALQTTLPPLDELRTWSSALGLVLPYGSADTKISANQTEKETKWNPWESNAEWKPWDGVSLRESFTYDLEKSRPSTSITLFKAGGFTAQYRHEQTTPYQFNSDPSALKWEVSGEPAFLPRELSLAYVYNLPSVQWWQYRNTLSSQLNFQWPINLQQYSNMPMSLNYTVTYKLHRFLDFTVTEGVKNNTAYRYFPFITDALGGVVEPVNPLSDLWDAVSVWDNVALHRTGFKMTNLTVGLVHYLDDWVVKLDYTGAPELVGTGLNQQFQWKGLLTLLVQWYPVPELKTQMQVDKEGNLSILKNSP